MYTVKTNGKVTIQTENEKMAYETLSVQCGNRLSKRIEMSESVPCSDSQLFKTERTMHVITK